MNRLIQIQKELKAPKWQFNSFGKYKYRSCEDIVEAVKPLLAAHKLALLMKDEIINMWDRYYIEAVVELHDEDWKCVAYSTWYAREWDEQAWMSASQRTGSASSYARKYALCWLFAIDDWVDDDRTNEWKEEKIEEKKEKSWFNDWELKRLSESKEYVNKFNTPDSLISEISKKYNISKAMKENIWEVRADMKE